MPWVGDRRSRVDAPRRVAARSMSPDAPVMRVAHDIDPATISSCCCLFMGAATPAQPSTSASEYSSATKVDPLTSRVAAPARSRCDGSEGCRLTGSSVIADAPSCVVVDAHAARARARSLPAAQKSIRASVRSARRSRDGDGLARSTRQAVRNAAARSRVERSSRSAPIFSPEPQPGLALTGAFFSRASVHVTSLSRVVVAAAARGTGCFRDVGVRPPDVSRRITRLGSSRTSWRTALRRRRAGEPRLPPRSATPRWRMTCILGERQVVRPALITPHAPERRAQEFARHRLPVTSLQSACEPEHRVACRLCTCRRAAVPPPPGSLTRGTPPRIQAAE